MDSQILTRPSPLKVRHAMVAVDGKLYDYQGETDWSGEREVVVSATLRKRARAAGIDTWEGDKELAGEIIEYAVELAQGLYS